MPGQTLISEWKALATDPLVRLRAVREYAHVVFGDAAIAAAWLSNPHRSVCGGIIAVGAACQTPTGFFEAIAELTRLEQEARRVALARAQDELPEPPYARPAIHADNESSIADLTAASVRPVRTGT